MGGLGVGVFGREGETTTHVGSRAAEFALEDTAGTVHRLEHYRATSF
jgi:hypothetical protein